MFCTGAFVCYYVAEVFLMCSGVLSIVTYGLVLNLRRSNISPEVEHFVEEFWHIIVFFAKTLIFIVEGVHTRLALANTADVWHDAGKLLVLFAVMNASRVVFVFGCLPLFNANRHTVDSRHAALIAFAGVRGDVPLALVTLVATMKATGIPQDIEELITYHVGGLVMLSILCNGLLSHKVIDLLGISDVPAHRRFAMQRALRTVTLENDRYARTLQGDPVLADAPWDSVEFATAEKLASPWPHLPLDDLTPDERLEMSRVQVLRAVRIEVWRMYRDGLARQATIRRLVALADRGLNEDLSLEEMAWHVAGHLMDLRSDSYWGYWLAKLLGVCSVRYERPRAVFNAYDAGFTFVQAVQAVQDRLHHLCVDTRSANELKYTCMGALSIVRQRLQALDVEYPKVTQSMKLRGAARLLLNADRRAVQTLAHHGLIDEDDSELLIRRVERYMVRLEDLPLTMSVGLPEQVLSATGWFRYLTTAAQQRLISCGTITVKEKDCIQPMDTVALGLGLVVYGVVRAIPLDNDDSWYLGPGQPLNVLSVISGRKAGHALFAQSSRVTFYWFPLEVVQKVLDECPGARRELVRAIAVRLCTRILSRYLPYALWGVAKVMATVERGWLLDLSPPPPAPPSSQFARDSFGLSRRGPANSQPRTSGSSGLYHIRTSGSLSVPGASTSVEFPRQQPVQGDGTGQVLLGMVPQYEYVLLYGLASFPDRKGEMMGPCVLHAVDPTTEPMSLPDALVMGPTWLRTTPDSWVVAIPKYDLDEEEHEDEDDPRGTPLAGGRDVVDFAMDSDTQSVLGGEATGSTLMSYVTRLIHTSSSHRREPSEDRVPLLDSLGRWGRVSRTPSSHGRPAPPSRAPAARPSLTAYVQRNRHA